MRGQGLALTSGAAGAHIPALPGAQWAPCLDRPDRLEKTIKLSSRFAAALFAAGLGLCSAASAQKEVTFAHQDMLVPFHTVMESGELERATG